MRDWRHSSVIQSLLQRPAIQAEWRRILQSQPQLRSHFGWNQHNTGRVEGYPEKQSKPHLQDLLEYYKSGDNAAGLAQLAFRKIAFPERPPPAPCKDSPSQHAGDTLSNSVSWDMLGNTIREDEFSPIDVCELDYGVASDAFGVLESAFY